MTAISTEELYQLVIANPQYLEAVRRFFQYGEMPPELEGERFPNLERIAAEIKRQLSGEEP